VPRLPGNLSVVSEARPRENSVAVFTSCFSPRRITTMQMHELTSYVDFEEALSRPERVDSRAQ